MSRLSPDSSGGELTLVWDVLDRVQAILEDAGSQSRPLEMEPFRSSLFELFVVADGAGLLDEEDPTGLSADNLTRMLGERWKLRTATAESIQQGAPLSQQDLGRMRLLWSFLRMWMEWTYAWRRWAEFHGAAAIGSDAAVAAAGSDAAATEQPAPATGA